MAKEEQNPYDTARLPFDDWVALHHDEMTPQEMDTLFLYAVKNNIGSRVMTRARFNEHFYKSTDGRTIQIVPATVPIPCIVTMFLLGAFSILFMLGGIFTFLASLIR